MKNSPSKNLRIELCKLIDHVIKLTQDGQRSPNPRELDQLATLLAKVARMFQRWFATLEKRPIYSCEVWDNVQFLLHPQKTDDGLIPFKTWLLVVGLEASWLLENLL